MQTLLEINGSLNMIGYAIATIAPALSVATAAAIARSATALVATAVAIAPALGVAWIFASVINGTARQPEARGAMMSTAFIGFAVVEALAIIAIALAFVLQ